MCSYPLLTETSLFAEGHNRGPLSTEHNQSPEQLWIRGMLSNSTGRIAEEFNGQVFNSDDSSSYNAKFGSAGIHTRV